MILSHAGRQYLSTFEGKLDLDVARFLADPQENLVPSVQNHYIIVREVILQHVTHFFMTVKDTQVTVETNSTRRVGSLEDVNPYRVPWQHPAPAVPGARAPHSTAQANLRNLFG